MGTISHLLITTILAALVFVYISHRVWPGQIEKAISWFVSSLIIVASLCVLTFYHRGDVALFVTASVSTIGGLWFCFFSSMNLWGFWQNERRKVDEALRHMLIWEGAAQRPWPQERGSAEERRDQPFAGEDSGVPAPRGTGSAWPAQSRETCLPTDSPAPRTEDPSNSRPPPFEECSLAGDAIASDAVETPPHHDHNDTADTGSDTRVAGETPVEPILVHETDYPVENIVAAIQSIEAVDAVADPEGKEGIQHAEVSGVPAATAVLGLVEAVQAAGIAGRSYADDNGSEGGAVPENVSVKCDHCERLFTLERDALVSAIFQVISEPISEEDGGVRISPSGTSLDAPDLIAGLDRNWASLDSKTARSQKEAVSRIKALLELGEPRWWKCYHCDHVHGYRESLTSQERSIETSGPSGS